MQPTTLHSDNALIADILDGRETTLRRLYPLYAAEFKAWARRQGQFSDDDLTDAYQEAFVAFYRNVVGGKLTQLTAALKTYLFTIGIRHLWRIQKLNQRTDTLSPLVEQDAPTDPNILQILIEEEAYQQQKHYVARALHRLPSACQRVLELYFYENYSIPQIKDAMGYQSENSVSVQKSRCLKSLRDVLEAENL